MSPGTQKLIDDLDRRRRMVTEEDERLAGSLDDFITALQAAGMYAQAKAVIAANGALAVLSQAERAA